MKQTIRNNTFETNSSSMHSLVVVKDPKPYRQDELLSTFGDDKFDLFWCDSSDGYYERFPFRVMRTPIEKLRYYVAHYIGACKHLELIPKVTDFISNQLHIPKEKIILDIDEDRYCRDEDDNSERDLNYGYAGTNDTGEDVFTYIERNNISMEEFVLNPKYVVIIDGDEYQEFKKLFESNILDANNFEYISTGPEFWNDSIYEISSYWLEHDRDDYILLEHIQDINKFVKEIRLNLYEENLDNYEQYSDEFKMFINEVKKNFPDIEVSVACIKDIAQKVKKKDLSIFNYLKIRKYEFSDDFIEIIKLKG